jgi:hypothetical protein
LWGLTETMPQGTSAPGKVFPPPAVPIKGFTHWERPGADFAPAQAVAQKSKTTMIHFFEKNMAFLEH